MAAAIISVLALCGSLAHAAESATSTAVQSQTASDSSSATADTSQMRILHGRVFIDTNENGLYDPDETLLANNEVWLVGANKSLAWPNVRTDHQGFYEFTYLRLETYDNVVYGKCCSFSQAITCMRTCLLFNLAWPRPG